MEMNEEKKCDDGMFITESTLELQGLSGGELAELARGQSELVTLKLQRDGSLRLGDAILTACYVGQLGDLHHVSTFNKEEERKRRRFNKEAAEMSDIFHSYKNKKRRSASVSFKKKRVKRRQNMQNQGGLIRGTSAAAPPQQNQSSSYVNKP